MRVAGNGIGASLREGRRPLSGRAADAALECPERGLLSLAQAVANNPAIPWRVAFGGMDAGTGTSGAVLEARKLVKRFGEREALRGVDFEASAGELVAVIGPNGAGKTTLLSILAGISKPDGGEVHVPQGEVGWVPQQAALYRRLTVEENLMLFARLEKHEDPRAPAEEMLELTGLGERRGEIVARLSGGNQQRINIAIGLLVAAFGAAARRAQRRARPAAAGAALGVRLGARLGAAGRR